MIDAVDPIVNSEPPALHTSNGCTNLLKTDTRNFDKYLTDVEKRLNSYSDFMENSRNKFDGMVESLSELISVNSNRPVSENPSSPAMVPNTQSPLSSDTILCNPYVIYSPNAINDTVKHSLEEFISANENDFKNIGNSRDTLYYGQYGYKYSGGEHKPKAMPPPLQELIDLIKPKLSVPESVLNSCLITRYKSGSDFIPLHRDDEPLFNPESEIVTVSIGANRTMEFVYNQGKKSEEVILEDKSMLITSRKAQNFWQHGIKKSDVECGVRYSFTFRHISPHFLNSTIIVGDSNTKFLKFGEEKGMFGRWMPGKRVEALHVEDIPDPINIGPYRNIVLHVGINNIKNRNRLSYKTLGNMLETKCKNILDIYPRSKLHLSLLLPTKLESLNIRVREFNNILLDLSHSYKNINVVDHPIAELCNAGGSLRDDLGRYDRDSQAPLAKDALHLGKKGLRIFAKTLKSSVIGRYKSQQGQHGASAGGRVHVNSPPT